MELSVRLSPLKKAISIIVFTWTFANASAVENCEDCGEGKQQQAEAAPSAGGTLLSGLVEAVEEAPEADLQKPAKPAELTAPGSPNLK